MTKRILSPMDQREFADSLYNRGYDGSAAVVMAMPPSDWEDFARNPVVRTEMVRIKNDFPPFAV